MAAPAPNPDDPSSSSTSEDDQDNLDPDTSNESPKFTNYPRDSSFNADTALVANATLRDSSFDPAPIIPEHILIHVDLDGNIHHLLHFYERYDPADVLAAFFANRVSTDELLSQQANNQTMSAAPTLEAIDNLPPPVPALPDTASTEAQHGSIDPKSDSSASIFLEDIFAVDTSSITSSHEDSANVSNDEEEEGDNEEEEN